MLILVRSEDHLHMWLSNLIRIQIAGNSVTGAFGTPSRTPPNIDHLEGL